MTLLRLFFLLCCAYVSTAQSPTIDSLLLIDKAEVYFETGLSELDSSSLVTISTFHANSSKRKCDSVYISAHTDNVGEDGNNMALSLARAQVVRQQLIDLGMAANSIRIEEFGESQPIASNLTARGRKLNRRSALTAFKKIRMTKLSGHLRDEVTQKGIRGNVYVGTAIVKSNLITDSLGYFETTVPVGAVVKMRPSAYGYFMASDTLFKPKPPVDIKVDLYLRPKLKDIAVETYIYKGQLVDSLTGFGLKGEIKIIMKNDVQTYESQGDGTFEILLRADQRAELKALVRDYLPTSFTIEQPKNSDVHVIRLSPLLKGSAMTFNDLVFENSEAILMKSSESELEQILNFMRLNPSVRIEIAGHVDDAYSPPLEKNEPLFLLSVDRAKAIYDYLVENGIDESRMIYEGYGNWYPVFPEPQTDEEHEANRRVEIKILNED
ncbi:MAG: OmpA family protein [Bacteroidota bacterium]